MKAFQTYIMQRLILIITELNEKVVGIMQLVFTTYMTYQGGKGAQIEGVRE